MIRNPRSFVALLAALFVAVPAVAAPHATADSSAAAQPLTYLATVVDPLSPRPAMVSHQVRISLDRLSSQERLKALEQAMSKNQTAFTQQVLGAETVGSLQIGTRLPIPIAFASRFEDEKGSHLLLIAQRPISIREIFSSSPRRDYPFTVLQLDLEPDGHGSGELIWAARFRSLKDGGLRLDNFNFISARLLDLRSVEAG